MVILTFCNLQDNSIQEAIIDKESRIFFAVCCADKETSKKPFSQKIYVKKKFM